MFRIKICGVTRVEDADAAIAAGAEAVGLNFYRDGKRCISEQRAVEIAGAIGNRAEKVGVFVNSPREEVEHLHDRLGLAWVQLHGDETIEYLQTMGAATKIIRVYRMGVVEIDDVLDDLLIAREAGRLPDALMLDAAQRGSYGGTGSTVDWSAAACLRELLSLRGLPPLPWVLAGGLTPANVQQAILTAHPDAVDVASGVESSPGIKESELMKQFIASAQRGFATLRQETKE